MKIHSLSFLALAGILCLTGCGSSKKEQEVQKEAQQEVIQDTSFVNSQYWLPVEHIIYNEDGEEIFKNTYKYDKDGFLTSCNYSNYLDSRNRATMECTVTSNDNQVTINGKITKLEEQKTRTSQSIYTFNENDVLISCDWDDSVSTYEGNGVNSFLDENGKPCININGYVMDCSDMEYPVPYFRISIHTDKHVLEEAKQTMTEEEILLRYGQIELYYDETEKTYLDLRNVFYSQRLPVKMIMLGGPEIKYPYGIWNNKTINAEDKTVTTTVNYENGTVGEKITWRPVTKRAAQTFYHFDWDSDYINATLKLLDYEAY